MSIDLQNIFSALGSLLAREGFKGIGVNALAREAGVDKVFIYRYFGGLKGVIAAFGKEGDFWLSALELEAVREQSIMEFVKLFFLKDKTEVDLQAIVMLMGAGWRVITSSGTSVRDLFECGRQFQRMALLAREKMMAVHPMTQTLEEKQGRETIEKHHDSSMIPQFMLRVGYLEKYPDPVSLRRPVSWFLKG